MKSALVILVVSMNLYSIIVRAIFVDPYYDIFRRYPNRDNSDIITDCKKASIEWKNNMKIAECNLRETLVKIPNNDTDDHYAPDHVLVNRCSGIAVSPRACVPKKVQKKNFVVKKSSEHFKLCHNVQVEEHTKCGFGCIVGKNDCNEKQEYREDSCGCVCINVEEMNECRKSNNMMWDEKECSCICNLHDPCGTGNKWVPDMCKCVKIMKSDNNYIGLVTY
ncbi:balbiani ring protein 3 [Cephus cinctus]|uniref:Balbiani ring protein 3 n=1 Tax=Cephus cinctus TaxID=211228 RepID=A0AAJ7BS26_CEPCN|nr:balbiani ring protein 3 [Cephus cinctus]